MTRLNIALILIASLAGAAGGALATALLMPAPLNPSVAAATNDPRIAEVAKAQLELQKAVAELRAAQAMLAPNSERTPISAGASATTSGETPASSTGVAALGNVVNAPDLTVESALAKLADPDLSYPETMALWEKVNKAGLLDQVVNAIKERADREPNNPDLRVELGNAYLQEVFAASTMGKGKWATKADEAFNAALELNPEHWEARFTKAVSLSNWPAFMGKQGLAIAEFETLVKQQNSGPKKPEHAQTYLYLGNMYQASGSMAKALEAWEKGAVLFPDNAALQTQIAGAKKL